MRRQLSVIIAEDKPLDRMKIEQYAHELNLKIVSSVASGEWFIDECVKYEPDIVLVNVGLHGTDGISAFRKIQEKGIKSHLILVTGTHDLNLFLEAIKLNCVDFIHKPVELDRLAEAIKKVKDIIDKELLISKSIPGRILKIMSHYRTLYINERNLIYATKVKGEHKTILYIEGDKQEGVETKMSLSDIQNQCSEWIFSPNQSNLVNMNFIHKVYASENFMGSYVIRLLFNDTEIDLTRRNRKKFDYLYSKLNLGV
ncbi:response regulator transcription factor (plasmid) [Paenibacillus sonchi]|uniref:Response regulator transcription factor n=1 Tax=Paenibacillus sonchi TaxID=373687 RepID=A0A974PI80_9BACL|nr:LytTR family DNA-binding domain-containing protein [Paenibacillus sonchi]QQZ64469.1 response regulator transcription factor [Paenibacillus sonchi]